MNNLQIYDEYRFVDIKGAFNKEPGVKDTKEPFWFNDKDSYFQDKRRQDRLVKTIEDSGHTKEEFDQLNQELSKYNMRLSFPYYEPVADYYSWTVGKTYRIHTFNDVDYVILQMGNKSKKLKLSNLKAAVDYICLYVVDSREEKRKKARSYQDEKRKQIRSVQPVKSIRPPGDDPEGLYTDEDNIEESISVKTFEEMGSGDLPCGSCGKKKKKNKKLMLKKMKKMKWASDMMSEELVGFGGDESDYPNTKKVEIKETDKVEVEEPVKEEPNGLTDKQKKNLPQALQDAILKSRAKKAKKMAQAETKKPLK